jgi:transglutaminase/protease-like cytokinesis protein 3
MNLKIVKSVSLVLAVGIVTAEVLIPGSPIISNPESGGTYITLEDSYEVVPYSSSQLDFTQAAVSINTIEELRLAFIAQSMELNGNFFLNINSSIDVKKAFQQFALNINSCSWKCQIPMDADGNQVDDGAYIYMFTVEYRDDFKVLQAFNNNALIEKLSEAESAMLAKAEGIIADLINDDMNDYERVLAIHDYIVLNASYQLQSDDPEIHRSLFRAEGVLMNGAGVCGSYTGTMSLLLGMAGIESIYVTGIGQNSSGLSELHAWNKVRIDGQWYNFDVTWNDPSPDKPDGISYAYFGLTDEALSKDHVWNTDIYPQSADSDYYNYYKYNNLYSNDYTQFKEIVTKLLLEQAGKSQIEIHLFVNNYDLETYNLSFIFSVLSNVTRASHSRIAGSSGEFVLRITHEVKSI